MGIYKNGLSLYEQIEMAEKSRCELRCIDGQITGCGKCVGYCNYGGHPGFLTAKQRHDHDCINKKCYHYIKKERTKRKKSKGTTYDSQLLAFAEKHTTCYEGMKFIRAENKSENQWCLRYITISNAYPIESIEKDLCSKTGYDIKLERMNYNFDVCLELIFSK